MARASGWLLVFASLATFIAGARASPDAGAPELVAVLELDNQLPPAQRDQLGDRSRFSEALRQAIRAVRSPHRVLSRAEMQELASANPEQLDRCDDRDCQALGRLLGADAVLESAVLREKEELVLSLRLVDTRSGKTRAEVKIRAATVEALLAAAGPAAASLIAPPAARP